MSVVVSVRDLVVAYGDLEVVKGVSLDVRQGEKIVIMGPSGSGKSTYLRSLIWLVKPRRGRIVIDGVEVRQDTVREALQMVGLLDKANAYPLQLSGG